MYEEKPQIKQHDADARCDSSDVGEASVASITPHSCCAGIDNAPTPESQRRETANTARDWWHFKVEVVPLKLALPFQVDDAILGPLLVGKSLEVSV
jgi:hypothetical protein